MNTILPAPTKEAQKLSDALVALVKDKIAQKGPLSFEQYMSLALYAPGLGYYRNPLPKLGEAGDFVTAPELSPLFSQCIARQCAQVLSDLEGGDIVEFGAGRGVMAADILLYLQQIHQLPTHYYILEISAQLQKIQQETIRQKAPALLDRVLWLQALPLSPIRGVVLANEVLDAMPVTLFRWENKPVSYGVTMVKDQLAYSVLPDKNPALHAHVAGLEMDFSAGYTSEVNLQLSGWIRSVSDMLQHGLVLLIDYGFPRQAYYHSDRHMGTLMCHYQHFAHSDPFLYPGLQDITAHVDFTAVAEVASDNGLTVTGYINQAGFLLNCGLLSLLDGNHDEKQRFSQNQSVLKLTMPSEMGELFKVVGLTKSYEATLLGFEKMNQLARLG